MRRRAGRTRPAGSRAPGAACRLGFGSERLPGDGGVPAPGAPTATARVEEERLAARKSVHERDALARTEHEQGLAEGFCEGRVGREELLLKSPTSKLTRDVWKLRTIDPVTSIFACRLVAPIRCSSLKSCFLTFILLNT